MDSVTNLGSGTVRQLRSVTSRYDLLLGLIPTAFGAAVVAAGVSSLPLEATLFVAAVVGLMVILEALFRNPPLADRSSPPDN